MNENLRVNSGKVWLRVQERQQREEEKRDRFATTHADRIVRRSMDKIEDGEFVFPVKSGFVGILRDCVRTDDAANLMYEKALDELEERGIQGEFHRFIGGSLSGPYSFLGMIVRNIEGVEIEHQHDDDITEKSVVFPPLAD